MAFALREITAFFTFTARGSEFCMGTALQTPPWQTGATMLARRADYFRFTEITSRTRLLTN